jgi:hypothetical protein
VYVELKKKVFTRFHVHVDQGDEWNHHGLSTSKKLQKATPSELKEEQIVSTSNFLDLEDDGKAPGRPRRQLNPTPRFAPMYTYKAVHEDSKVPTTAKGPANSLCDIAYQAFAATESLVAEDNIKTPATFRQAMQSPERTHWLAGTKAELASLRKFGVYTIKQVPKGAKLVQTKWVYRVKRDENGKVSKFKVRLVMKGFTQQEGVHFHATFAPVARLASFRTLMALAAQHGLALTQLDFTCAYLHSILKEEIYANPPPGIECPKGFAWLLHKAVYGLRQSGREWYRTLDKSLRDLGFKRLHSDPCMYVKRNPKDDSQMIILLVYVDDVIVASNWPDAHADLTSRIGKDYNVKDLGQLRWFLGMLIVEDIKTGTIRISQRLYFEQVLRRFGFWGAKPQTTPADPTVPLTNLSSEYFPSPDEAKEISEFPYREVIGSLMYGACVTRPDLSATVGFLARAMSNPRHEHIRAAKRCLRYIKGTLSLGITYRKSVIPQPLSGYVDSSWGGDEERRSTSGFVFVLADGPIVWGSKKQRSVAISSCEAEYYAASLATQDAIWLRTLLAELRHPCKGATTIHEDNTGCIRIAKDPCSHSKSKHIAIRHHFVRQQVQEGAVALVYITTKNNIADLFTKVLGKQLHSNFTLMLLSSK